MEIEPRWNCAATKTIRIVPSVSRRPIRETPAKQSLDGARLGSKLVAVSRPPAQISRNEGSELKNRQMWMIMTLLVLCIGVSASGSVPGEEASSVSYCDLLSFPQRYDKGIVATRALIQSSEHEIHIFDSECKSSMTDDRSASVELPHGWTSTKLGKRLSKILRHNRTARVAFEAAFYGSGGPYGPERTRFRFVLQRLISVEEVPNKEPNRSSQL